MIYDDDGSDPCDEPQPSIERSAEVPPPMWQRRNKTIAMRRLTRAEVQIGALLWPERNFWRPNHRRDCKVVARPCPHVSCKHHLYLDVLPETGSIKLNFPELEPWELEQSCALDLADRGEHTLDEVGICMNLTRERVRQIESAAFAKLREMAVLAPLRHAFITPDAPIDPEPCGGLCDEGEDL